MVSSHRTYTEIKDDDVDKVIEEMYNDKDDKLSSGIFFSRDSSMYYSTFFGLRNFVKKRQ